MKKEIKKKSASKKNGTSNIQIKYTYEIIDDDNLTR